MSRSKLTLGISSMGSPWPVFRSSKGIAIILLQARAFINPRRSGYNGVLGSEACLEGSRVLGVLLSGWTSGIRELDREEGIAREKRKGRWGL